MEKQLYKADLDALKQVGPEFFHTRTPLLTAGGREKYNTMTIGWGGVGTLWRKPVCTVYVRPQRYTYELMEKSDCFTVSLLPQQMDEALKFCGTKSGRDFDKAAKCGLTVQFTEEGAPYFQEAELVLACRKLYADDLRPACFTDAAIPGEIYPDQDYHRFYVGEIETVLVK